MTWLALSCAGATAAPGGPPGESYDAELGQWTAKSQLFKGVDKVVDAAATFQSLAFREARARRSAELQALPSAAAEALLASEREEAKGEDDFFMGLSIDPPSANDLNEKDSVWHVTLLLPDGTVLPALSVRQFYHPDPNLVAIYPYLQRFWVGYWLRFAAADASGRRYLAQGGRVTLRLASALGRAELPFEIPRSL